MEYHAETMQAISCRPGNPVPKSLCAIDCHGAWPRIPAHWRIRASGECLARQCGPHRLDSLPAMNPVDEDRIGGQGLRLMRGFASALEYEAMPHGNRLRISFSAQGFPAGTK